MKFIKYFLLLGMIFTPLANAFSDINTKNAPLIRLRHRQDKREIKNNSSPKILNAVGKLTIRRKKNRFSKVKVDCTANLIAPDINMGSDIIITAKHCTHKDIRDYKWESSNKNGPIIRTAKLIYSDNQNDWALLKFTKPIEYEEIKPLIINSDTFENTDFQKTDNEQFIKTGFSVDWLGDYGNKLTYEENPSYIEFANKGDHIGKIGALTHQGDSGGAIIYKRNEHNYLVGIMSYIAPDENLFKSTKGTFGNLSGYFIDFIKYKASHMIFDRYLN